MDSFQANKLVENSDETLIDWSTPEMVKNVCFVKEDFVNNPFDVMELKAANMDPFDLVLNQTPSREEPPCANILSPLWELEVRQIKGNVSLTDVEGAEKILEQNYGEHTVKDDVVGNVSLTDIEGIGKISEQNYAEHVKDEIVGDQSKCDYVSVDWSKENCVQVNANEIKVENQEQKIDTVLTPDHNEIDIDKMSFCNEEEKILIREQTRQRIKMLIQNMKKNYEEKNPSISSFCMSQCDSESSLDKTESMLNKGFRCRTSDSNSNSDNFIDIIDNTSGSSGLSNHDELNLFDLNSLKPEWIVDNFSDSDKSVEVQTENSVSVAKMTNNNCQVDGKLKALNHIGIVESKLNGCQTVLKSIKTKRTQSKGPCLASVPVQHMVQHYRGADIKESSDASDSSRSQMKPVAFSTPTSNIAAMFKSPSSVESSVISRSSLTRRSVLNSDESPSTPLNATKCIQTKSTNNETKIAMPNTSCLKNLTNKRSNMTVVLFNGANDRKTEMIKSFKLNKSQSDSKLGMVPKPMVLHTNSTSSLPVLKRFPVPIKGKENVKLQ